MALCRFGWDGSDVYVFYDTGGFINCCGCALGERSFHADTELQMIGHLKEHQKRGHSVPEYVFDELSETARN
jgi:hypothetical protein